MTAENIAIVVLLFTCSGLCCWCMYLDWKVTDLQGYIKRMEDDPDG